MTTDRDSAIASPMRVQRRPGVSICDDPSVPPDDTHHRKRRAPQRPEIGPAHGRSTVRLHRVSRGEGRRAAGDRAGERRVALVPESVEAAAARLRGRRRARRRRGGGFPDDAYEEAGAELVDSALRRATSSSRSRRRRADEVARLRERRGPRRLPAPLTDPDGIERLAARGVTAFAMESIPRITRAQPMDALSSQATVSGYKAALLAADRLPRFFPMLMTAAGTVAPAKVLVLGAGVAGLQAIATARRLGAVVTGFDVRPVVKEQVESLGATFLELSACAARRPRAATRRS